MKTYISWKSYSVTMLAFLAISPNAQSLTLPVPSFTPQSKLTSTALTNNFDALLAPLNKFLGQPCANAGEFLTGIDAMGTPICTAMPVNPADITEVNTAAGSGLTGGNTSGAINLAIDANVVQKRVTPACTAGQYIQDIGVTGTPNCVNLPPIPGGDITDVTTAAGSGLLGGAASGAANLSIDETVVQRRFKSGTCGGSQYVQDISVNGTPTCVTDSDTTYTQGNGITINASNVISRAVVTQDYSIPGNDFLPASYSDYANWARYDIEAYGYPKTDTAFYVTKGVFLPSGASINNVHCFFYDNDATYDIDGYYFDLRATTFSSASSTSIASASGTATTGQSTTIIDVAVTSLTTPHVVNNSINSYNIVVNFDASPGAVAGSFANIRFYGCKINYTL